MESFVTQKALIDEGMLAYERRDHAKLAMLTGKALGNFGTLQEAAACMVREGKTFLPRKEMHGKYQELFERYRNVYSAVRPLV